MLNRILFFLILFAFIFSCEAPDSGAKKILVFSKTEGFRHESIGAGIKAIKKMGLENDIEVITSENSKIFTQQKLENVLCVVFLNTTGDILNNTQQYEFKRYIQAGGSFVGIHAAADTEYDWPWYGKLVGAYFNGHPNNPNVRDAIVEVIDSTHISCNHIHQERWPRTDEWYNYKSINGDIKVLLNLDETSYEGGTNGENHPIAWYHEFDGGRAFYTGGGHTNESFEEPKFYQHILGGIQYAMGDMKGPNYDLVTVAPEENRFTKNVLDHGLNEPMELDLMPDGKIVFIERKGKVKLYDPAKDKTEVINELNVHTTHEDGLLGVALDPDFSSNSWIYLCYSPAGDEPKQHVSRFDFKDGKLDLSSEKILLEVPVQRVECCHSAGALEFGPKGYLFASFGDNTNPHFSDGYSPSDEIPGRYPFDAQKSSSNTNDLRGGIIRISPTEDGGYTIPDGNLFAKDGSEGRPEIYVMGCRNPYRFSIDPKSYYLYWGDVGPDAGKDSLNRGPKGYDEVNQARKPGFFGWPYFIADNKAYHEYDFERKKIGQAHDPSKPINNSPNNTGKQELPAAQAAFVWYPYGKSEEFPLVGDGGRNAMAGPVYHRNMYSDASKAFPKYYDGKLFIYDWMRGWFMAVTMNDEGDFVDMEPFLPSSKFSNPTDVLIGPDGDFYMLEYGTNWFSQNNDARLVHLTYSQGNRKPVAKVGAENTIGAAPLAVNFESQSKDPDGDELKYKWTFEGEEVQSTEANPSYTFNEPGFYQVKLVVEDQEGLLSESSIPVSVGNDLPQVAISYKGNQSFYFPGAPSEYSIAVTDTEDGKLGEGIEAKDVMVSLDYLKDGVDMNEIGIGHAAMMELGLQNLGKKLMQNSDCYTCHKDEKKGIGPTNKEIGKKYINDANAIEYLSSKIINGGGGVWGETVMAAHPALPPADVEKMVQYILSLGEDKKDLAKTNIGASGSLQFDKHKPEDVQGTYLLTASYQDKGNGESSSLTSRDIIVLKSPTVMAATFDDAEKASKFKLEPGMMPGVEEEIELVIGLNDSHIQFNQLDFTGIGSIVFMASLVPEFSKGGKVEFVLDSPDGKIIGSQMLEMKPENFGNKMYNMSIEPNEGKHDLYVKFSEAGEDGGMVCALISMTFIQG